MGSERAVGSRGFGGKGGHFQFRTGRPGIWTWYLTEARAGQIGAGEIEIVTVRGGRGGHGHEGRLTWQQGSRGDTSMRPQSADGHLSTRGTEDAAGCQECPSPPAAAAACLPPATCLMPHCHQGLSGRKGTQPRGYPEHAALGLPQSQPSLNADDCCFS